MLLQRGYVRLKCTNKVICTPKKENMSPIIIFFDGQENSYDLYLLVPVNIQQALDNRFCRKRRSFAARIDQIEQRRENDVGVVWYRWHRGVPCGPCQVQRSRNYQARTLHQVVFIGSERWLCWYHNQRRQKEEGMKERKQERKKAKKAMKE